jgi:hypothetical protein
VTDTRNETVTINKVLYDELGKTAWWVKFLHANRFNIRNDPERFKEFMDIANDHAETAFKLFKEGQL